MSIRHIVLWKIAAEDADTRALHAQQIAERLLALPAQVESIRRIEVGPNVVASPGNWDVAVVSEFDDVEGLEAYQVDPAHQEAAAFIRSVVSERAVVDYPF